MRRCPDCGDRGTNDPCHSGAAMYCATCGGSGGVNFHDCEACGLKKGRIKVLEAEIERLQNSLGDQPTMLLSAKAAEDRIKELDQALNSAISSAVEARKERAAAEKALVDLVANQGEDE